MSGRRVAFFVGGERTVFEGGHVVFDVDGCLWRQSEPLWWSVCYHGLPGISVTVLSRWVRMISIGVLRSAARKTGTCDDVTYAPVMVAIHAENYERLVLSS